VCWMWHLSRLSITRKRQRILVDEGMRDVAAKTGHGLRTTNERAVRLRQPPLQH